MTVEFALWTPFMAFVLLLVTNVSILMTEQTQMWRVASDAGRRVASGALAAAAVSSFAANQSLFGTSYTASAVEANGAVTVRLSIPLKDVVIGNLLPGSGSSVLRATVVYRVEPGRP